MEDSHANTEVQPEKWRLFIALPLRVEQIAALGDLQERLRKGAKFTPCRMTWPAPETLHLTLAFLGPRHAGDVALLREVLMASADGFTALRAEIKGLGVFPDWKHPKVLWCGVRERTRQLEPLRMKLATELGVRGFALDEKPFTPHLTIARFKAFTGSAAFQKIAAGHEQFRTPAQVLDELVLYRSELQQEGARHTVMHVVKLPEAAAVSEAEAEQQT